MQAMLRANAAINVGDCLSLLHHNLPCLLPPIDCHSEQREEEAGMPSQGPVSRRIPPMDSQSCIPTQEREETAGMPSHGPGSKAWQLAQVTKTISRDVLTKSQLSIDLRRMSLPLMCTICNLSHASNLSVSCLLVLGMASCCVCAGALGRLGHAHPA